MSLPVVWTKEATETFDNIVNVIEVKWGFQAAKNFVVQTERTITNISFHRYLFKSSHLPKIRHAVITKQTSLFYQVNSNNIALIFF